MKAEHYEASSTYPLIAQHSVFASKDGLSILLHTLVKLLDAMHWSPAQLSSALRPDANIRAQEKQLDEYQSAY